MLTLGRQRIDTLTLAAVAVLAAGVAALSLAVPVLMPWSFAAVAAAAVILCWAVKWEITVWAWLWVFSYGLLDWPGWRIELPGFFNLTVPRLIFLAAVAAFGVYFLAHGRRAKAGRALTWAMVALLVLCAVSATAAGWQARIPEARNAPYFRFFSSLLFPFLMFFLVCGAVRGRRELAWAAGVFIVYGWYALYVGYLQYAANTGLPGVRAWLWPPYINNPHPDFGIHFDRSRGAFRGAGPQAALLIVLFYIDLLVARRTRGWTRAACTVQAVLVPPAIFFTGLRSAYLAFLLCGGVWLWWAGKKRFGRTKLAVALVAVLIGVLALWSNLTSKRRQIGGVAQRGPVIARLILIRQTWQIVKRHPLTGVGFGHFADAQSRLERSPAGLDSLSAGVLAQHNLFLNMVAELGLVGLVVTIAVFVLLFRESLQLYHKLPPDGAGRLTQPAVVLFWVVLVSYLTDAMLRDPLWDPFSNGMFWALAGLLVGYNHLSRPSPQAVEGEAAEPAAPASAPATSGAAAPPAGG